MFRIIKLIYSHPLNRNRKLKSIFKFFAWQVASRLWKNSLVFNWIDDSKLIVSTGMTGATGNIYVGLMEYEDMSFLLHYLKEDDLFFDIGANVGAYTILASKVKKAKTVSIEPLPDTYEKLLDNIQINRLTNVISENIGLSFEKSKLYFTTNRDTMNSVALDTDISKQEVDVDTLDRLSNQYGIPKIIKMDIEGYETNVLKGARNVLESNTLEVVILELNGSGEKFGFKDDDIHNDLLGYGFLPFTYNPLKRDLILLDIYGTHNTIYIKSYVLGNIRLRLKNAKEFVIHKMNV